MDKAGTPTGVPAWFLRELRGFKDFKDFKDFKVFSGSAKSNKFVLLFTHLALSLHYGERKDDGRADWRV